MNQTPNYLNPSKMRATKTKRPGVIIAGYPTTLSEPTRRFLRGLLVLVLALGSLIALSARAQSNYPVPYNFNTFAGNAYGGNGTGSQAIFGHPYASALDSAGNVYVADTSNFAVRKITPTGIVTTLAGLAGTGGVANGTGSDARFGSLNGIAVDKAGNVYVTDGPNCTVRKITRTGVVTTLAGTPGAVGSTDGTGSAARFRTPFGITVDTAGNLYVTDRDNQTIRKITPAGVVTTIAGSAGVIGSADGSSSVARFYYPAGIAVDSAGNLYVADTFNYTIRKVTPGGSVSTFAGTAGVSGSANGTGSSAQFIYPYGVAVGGGNVYVADTWNCTIRKITSAGAVTTVAGTPRVPGAANGTGSAAQFNYPYGLSANSTGTIYVADSNNKEIRKITSAGAVSTLAGSATTDVGGAGSSNGTGRAARFNYPNGVAVSGTTVYVADSTNNMIRKITSTGAVTSFAGTAGVFGSADGTGSAARFYYPYGVAADKAGNVYVADTSNNTIRKITSAGVVTTLAGTPGVSGSANGTGNAARFNNPYAVAVDGSGNVYVADTLNFTVRKITPGGVVTTLAGLAGSSGSVDGTGSGARFSYLYGIGVDNAGNLSVTDAGNDTVRNITPAGVVTTLAGTRGVAGSADGTGSSARFDGPFGIAVDSTNNLYVGDHNNQVIRKITPAGVVTTLAGAAGSYGIADGMGSAARFLTPAGIAVASSGTIYVADSYNHEIRNGVPADLKISCTDGKTLVPNGTSDTYTITVTNTGLQNVNGAVVTDNFPAQVQNVTYLATGKGGATGFADSSGNIYQSLNLPPNSSVTYKATGLINGTSGTVISNTANVSVPPGVTDIITADNTATDKDTIQ
jgi:uncharacterized repeat protein (TIGR01451 family)